MTKQVSFTFVLDNNHKIIITTNNENQPINAFHTCQITFYKNKQKVLISEELPLQISLFPLKKLLQNSLNNSLQLHSSITKNIGFVYNQLLNEDTSNLIYVENEGIDFWVGDDYQLWSHRYASWMYNDKQSGIVFEITPVYPGVFNSDNKTSHEEYLRWMNSYEPYFIGIFSEKTAQQWLDQVTVILAEIEKNTQKIYESGEFLI